MTREQAQRWVYWGWARWLDGRTLEVRGGPPLMRSGQVVSPGGLSIVRFTSESGSRP